MNRFLGNFFVAALVLAPILPGFADETPNWSKGFSGVAKKAIPAVVFIEVEKNLTAEEQVERDTFQGEFFRRFFGEEFEPPPGDNYKETGQGSGFIITKDGYILTNAHVVGDTDRIIVKLHDGRELEAKLVGTDPRSEVAVIKIESEDDLPTIKLGKSKELEIGEWVVAVGNPFGLSETLTVGVVSAKGRSNIGIIENGGYEDFIQTDAVINPGNSGGPLLNIKGEAIGINTAIFSRSGGYMGIGFAIPMEMATGIKDQLIKKGKVDRGYIGIIILDVNEAIAEAVGLARTQGILIDRVAPNSAGERAGLTRGDIILKLNDKKIKNVAKFRNAVASNPPGTELSLRIFRGEKEEDVILKIGSLDELQVASVRPRRPEPKEAPSEGKTFGVEVEELTVEIAEKLGLEKSKGVVISGVEKKSAAEKAGLVAGEVIISVNRVPVASVKEFQQAVVKAGDASRVLLLVSDGESSRFLPISMK